jgi:hypothetical protein
VKTVMNFQAAYNLGDLWTSCGTVSSSDVLRLVSWLESQHLSLYVNVASTAFIKLFSSGDQFYWSECSTDQFYWSERSTDQFYWSECSTDQFYWSECSTDQFYWSEYSTDQFDWSECYTDQQNVLRTNFIGQNVLRNNFIGQNVLRANFIGQNVLRSPLLLSASKANCLRFSTTVCDTQFTLILFFLSFLD